MALCNSLMALKAFETGCVSSRLSHSSFFNKLNSQDKAAFPFLQGISFLLRSFRCASRTPRLFAGTKDVIPLRCSQDPPATGSR